MVKKRLEGLRVGTLTLGCKVNQYETEGMQELLERAGAEIVSFEETADVYLVNTCSVTNMAEKKSRQMLHRAKKRNPKAVVVAVGCYVQTTPEEVLRDLSVDLVIGNNRKKEIVSILLGYLDEHNKTEDVYWLDINQKQEYEELEIQHRSDHIRAYIKIQDGCNQFCTYCIIPYVRGRIRSRQPEDIVEEVTRMAKQGCKEIVLTGIHISSYGKDWTDEEVNSSRLDGMPLLSLLKQLNEINGIVRIRLGSLEPRIITEEFVQGLVRVTKLCPHFHLSLQSACNETLKRMNRKYTIEEYMDSCDRLRKVYDRPAITTDVIVGFPGETEEEFQMTYENLKRLNLYEMHVFKYSKRRGTVAEKLPDQIPEQIKNQRSDRLLELTAEQKCAYEETFRGEKLQVLIEENMETLENDTSDWYVGHTERYMKVKVPSKTDIRNRITEIIW